MTTNIPIKLGKCPSIYPSSTNLFIYKPGDVLLYEKARKETQLFLSTHKTNERDLK